MPGGEGVTVVPEAGAAGVTVMVGVLVARGASPSMVNVPEASQVSPAKICTSYSPGVQFPSHTGQSA